MIAKTLRQALAHSLKTDSLKLAYYSLHHNSKFHNKMSYDSHLPIVVLVSVNTQPLPPYVNNSSSKFHSLHLKPLPDMVCYS